MTDRSCRRRALAAATLDAHSDISASGAKPDIPEAGTKPEIPAARRCDRTATQAARRSQVDKAGPAKRTARGRLQAQSARRGGHGRPGEDRSPLEWQQSHSPTQTVTLWEPLASTEEGARSRRRDGFAGQAGQTTAWRASRRQQRVVDAKLWGNLAPAEQAAAERIYGAFCQLARGLGVSGCSLALERIDGGCRPDPDFLQAQVRDYLTWGRRCRRAAIDQPAIMAVLGEGRSCGEVDRLRRRRKGYTRDQLAEGLVLYCRLKGWHPG